jgi:uncharacterized protein (DUF433 family)
MIEQRGAYPADRAAALSGVPLSTVHDWARKKVLVPAVSAERVKLWSFSDLMALRIIYWLRHTKQADDGGTVPRTPMSEVKVILKQLEELDLDLWNENTGPRVNVDRGGNINVLDGDQRETKYRQRRLQAGEELDVTAPFDFALWEGSRGPDLHAPRPNLRIVPGKLGGAPHVLHTRLESQALAALEERGLPTAKIYRLYPDIRPEVIDEAIDLEAQLRHNLRPQQPQPQAA